MIKFLLFSLLLPYCFGKEYKAVDQLDLKSYMGKWYQVYGDKLFADTTETDTVIVDYSFRASEVDFPSYFTLAVEFSLAIIFATSIARDASLASLMTERAESSMAKARSLDSQQQTTRKLETSRFLTARRS